MFSNPMPSNPSVDEGTVLQVDPIRCLCRVRTLRGQTLREVQWLLPSGGSTRGADRFTPLPGDRVMINLGLGYPVIIGFFPRLQTADGATPILVDSGEELLDMGNYSPEGMVSWGDQNKPKDILMGDRIISSVGGSMMAVLRAGSLVLRSSRGSEIFMSKLHSLVRVMSRNWEHFTDAFSDVAKNYKDKVYRYTGYATTFLKSKVEDYDLHFYYGDVKTAEAVKTNYNLIDLVPAPENIIYKEQVTGEINQVLFQEKMRRTLNLNGEEEVWIYNGEHFTRVTSTAERLFLAWNDQNTITITEASIHIVHKDGADYIMDADGIRATFKRGNINMSETSILSTFAGGTVNMKEASITTNIGASTTTSVPGNITLQNGSGIAFVGPTQTRLTNASHSVTITASGVAIT